MSKIVKFDDSKMIGKVTEKSFFKDLPDTLAAEVFVAVDDYREQRLAAIMNETMDYAEKHVPGDGSGLGVFVSDIPMGGRAVGEVFVDPSMKTVSAINYKHSDVMTSVIERSGTLFAKHNVTPDTDSN